MASWEEDRQERREREWALACGGLSGRQRGKEVLKSAICLNILRQHDFCEKHKVQRDLKTKSLTGSFKNIAREEFSNESYWAAGSLRFQLHFVNI